MNIKEEIIKSFKWKKSVAYCADKLGISESEYVKLRNEIRKNKKQKRKFFGKTNADSGITEAVNLEKGEKTIAATSSTEPKSAEEIIKLLSIDTKEWKLSQYWNKQMGDHWRVSALVSKVKDTTESNLQKLLENWKPKTHKIPKVKLDKGKNAHTVCGVMSLQDIHFGKEGNETIDKDFEDTLINLLNRAVPSHYIEKMYFVVGGDLINMDTFNGTTTGGTPLDNCMTSTEAYIQAFDALHWGINYIKSFCKELVVVYIPGNHDRLSSFHLAHALSKSIECDEITWDIKYEERKVHVWQDNFNAFEHGDAVSKNTPVIYATEFAQEWG
nr:hypothetical protein [Gammaproteobacteria bacterium]